MARKFITSKEHALINSLTKELVQNFVAQEVIYYAISVEESITHDVYDESITKVYYQPVRFNARVKFGNPVVRSTGMGADTEYELEVYAHTQELNERNLKPREGDFVEFGQIVYEITGVTQPQMVFGQPNDKIQTRLVCVPSREGQFQVGNKSDEGIDNTTPVQRPNPRSLGGT